VRLEDRVRRTTARHPDREALRVGSQRLSYRELSALADDWAGAVRAGAGRGAPRCVAVVAHRTLEGYVGVLAALYSGATVVPVAPDWPAERIQMVLRECAVDVAVADATGLAALATAAEAGEVPPVFAPGRSPDAPTGKLRMLDCAASGAPVAQGQAEVAYVLFTSGSTGRPKGVPITHANVNRFLDTVSARYGFGPGDVVSQNFDFTFDLAFFDLFVTWGCGATLVHTPSGALRRLPRFVANQGLTVWFSVPSAISLTGKLGGLLPGAMPSLRWSLFCGEPLTAVDAAAWQAAAPQSTLENLYGPTELTIACSAYRWTPTSPDESVHGVVPIGAMFPSLDHLLLDDDGRIDPVEGELCVTGPQMFSGYLRPADDRGRFVEANGCRWYRTGDRVRSTDDGILIFIGRVDQQVKIQGYRIEVAEIEHHLGRIPGIERAAVVAVGHGIDRQLVACYVGHDLATDQIGAALLGSLPPYMIPRQCVRLDKLPLNGRGKLDRRRLETVVSSLTASVTKP
jgi:amino acid adenylation domain-containing protein